MIKVLKPGTLTTIQAGPRHDLRHRGVPSGGAADLLSLALANRLLDNAWDAAALETTLVGPQLQFEKSCAIAITGARTQVTHNGVDVPCHQAIQVRSGDVVTVGAAATGTRNYLAFSGGLEARKVLGSTATNLQAGFGGCKGRALVTGDALSARADRADLLQTPDRYRLMPSPGIALRTCLSLESQQLSGGSIERLFSENWQVDQRADRMGIRLAGAVLDVDSDGRMPSAPVFPGTVQCPTDGSPYLLSVDAGTVGGYPRVAQVARLDRHLIGQLRPGDRVRFASIEPDVAVAALREKHNYWRDWLPAISDII